uniref:hypothetical protein n=1 Tax=Nocardiopsis halophila TaxID=141692 RepID=UPI000348D67F|nr:hypothetical protein [Nocardiopsis halophila]
MARHHRFTLETGIRVHFCDPHPPWRRGSKEDSYRCTLEHANGLLRQYVPKGTACRRTRPST